MFIVEAVSVLIWSVWLILAWNVSGIKNPPPDFVIQGALFFAGIWLPFLALFIGVCRETVTKRLRCVPIAVGIPFVVSVVGVLWMQTHTGTDFKGLPIALSCLICGILSALLLIVYAIRTAVIKDRCEKSMEMSDDLIVSESASKWLIAFIVLTVVCVIIAVFGFIKSIV